MHKTVLEYNKLPLYKLVYETRNGLVASLDGTLKHVYILAMQNYDELYTSGELVSSAILKDDEVMAFGYLAISQYLDDELSEMMKQDNKY